MSIEHGTPPLAFAVRATEFVSTFPDGQDQLWRADVKACRNKVRCEIFRDVLFVESNGTAFIYGIEFEDGIPPELHPDLAKKQQHFIQFLRDQTRQDNEALGALAGLFDGHEYSSEAKATAAYIVKRPADLVIGLGYHNTDGDYERISIEADDDSWLTMARGTVPFDELGSDT